MYYKDIPKFGRLMWYRIKAFGLQSLRATENNLSDIIFQNWVVDNIAMPMIWRLYSSR